MRHSVSSLRLLRRLLTARKTSSLTAPSLRVHDLADLFVAHPREKTKQDGLSLVARQGPDRFLELGGLFLPQPLVAGGVRALVKLLVLELEPGRPAVVASQKVAGHAVEPSGVGHSTPAEVGEILQATLECGSRDVLGLLSTTAVVVDVREDLVEISVIKLLKGRGVFLGRLDQPALFFELGFGLTQSM